MDKPHGGTHCPYCASVRASLELAHEFHSATGYNGLTSLCGILVGCPECAKALTHDPNCANCITARLQLIALHYTHETYIFNKTSECGMINVCPLCLKESLKKGEPQPMDEHKFCFFSKPELVCTESFHEQPHKVQSRNKMRRLRSVLIQHSDSAFHKTDIWNGDVNGVAFALCNRALAIYEEETKLVDPSHAAEYKAVGDNFKDELKNPGNGVNVILRRIQNFVYFGEKGYASNISVQAQIAIARLILIELEAHNPGLLAHSGFGKPGYGLVKRVPGVRKKPAPRVKKEPFVPSCDWERPNLLVKAIFGDEFDGNDTTTASSNVQA